ncbi:MAG TPA: NAD(P)-dependent oxidoreductase [Pyrinomonadaceae bacterium]|jgi:nucleoside-diphosphate-sugar epimerase
MKIFVAGATGVVGRRVVPMLLKEGWSVTAVARTAEKIVALGRLGARPELVDLFDPAAVTRAVRMHDAVCNLTTGIPSSNRALLPFAWRRNDRIRKLVSRNLVEAAIEAGAGKFIQESFAPMYPSSGDRWIDERSPVRPGPHVRSAVTAEHNAAKFTEAGGQGVVLRFALFYGPDSGHTLDVIRMARAGWAAMFGTPEGYISSLHTDDAARAVVAALGAPAGVYNVADDEPVTKREFFAALAGALGVPPPRFLPGFIARLAGSVGETLARSQRISNGRFKEQTGWAPAYPSVREGFLALARQLVAGRHADHGVLERL